MFEQLRQGFDKLFGVINQLDTIKKVTIGSILLLVTVAFTYLLFFTDETNYGYLFTQLSSGDAAEIVKTLKEKNISYEIEDGNVKVPNSKVHELRLEMAASGLPKGDGVGFEIFNEQKLGTSEFVQEMNLKRALQGELARTISQISVVENARVHLVMPRKALFKEDEEEASASVVVRLKAGDKMTAGQIKSVVHLTASAIEGLVPGRVTVIDTAGNLLSRSINEAEAIFGETPIEFKSRMESDMSRRIEDMLSRVVGIGKVTAKVSVELDLERQEKHEEIFDPDQTVVRSERRLTENRQTKERGEGGVPGVQSNLPEETAEEGGSKQSASTARNRDLINYEINKVVRHSVKSAGEVKKLSVAVLVDGSYETTQDAEGNTQDKYIERSQKEIDQIRELVKQMVGFVEARGDSIEVTNIPFATELVEEEEPLIGFTQRYDFIPDLVRYGMIAILGILLIFFLFKPLMNWMMVVHESEQIAGLEEEQLEVVESMDKQLAEVKARIDASTSEYRDKITQMTQEDLQRTLMVLRMWIEDETV